MLPRLFGKLYGVLYIPAVETGIPAKVCGPLSRISSHDPWRPYYHVRPFLISSPAARDFVSCFVRYEKRTHTGSKKDGVKKKEIRTVAVPITDFNLVCAKLEKLLGRSVSDQEKFNSEKIYQKMLGTTAIDTSDASVSQSPSMKGMISPIGSSWRSIVTSEFGGRIDPINGSYSYHKGLDLGVPTGTPVRAAKDGTVLKTAYKRRRLWLLCDDRPRRWNCYIIRPLFQNTHFGGTSRQS
ncbi:hypothetical protein CAFE_09750 [Caprobacter fermentans]|uniref:Peptidase M23 domain-containing protein n=2 Tax=Caproicibacter fermentans TaxID=2576756 RepID=A0A6N8HY77_9FIRM|nr:hypothetical protein [Caproicibacter fermentans]